METVAENDFNPSNPYTYFRNGKDVPSNKRIDSFIGMVNENNWVPAFVLPTERYVNNIEGGQDEIRTFVRRLVDGEFGEIEKQRTIHFEIGNEFYWNRNDITPAQYGEVAAALLPEIFGGVEDSKKASDYYRIETSVQSGLGADDAKVVATALKNSKSYIKLLDISLVSRTH